MSGWRVQWREYRTHLKTPIAGEIKWEQGHDRESAASRAAEILASQDVCWVWVENLDAPHKGNTSERPKAHKEKKGK